jgi:raffinose/stachyose/melibiose transport system substrate-binding protein
LSKKFVMLAMCFVLLLSACSSSPTTSPVASNPASAPVKNEPTPKPQQVVLKSYMYGTGPTKDLFDAINKKFIEKYPNIKIESEMAPSDQFDSVIKTKLASGDSPDILGIRPGTSIKPMVDAGYLMDVE